MIEEIWIEYVSKRRRGGKPKRVHFIFLVVLFFWNPRCIDRNEITFPYLA
jgi:hypothetical protein